MSEKKTLVTVLDGNTVELLSIGSLDDAIKVLCVRRFEQDPAGYLDFVETLIPKHAQVAGTLTYLDVALAANKPQR